MMPDPGSPWERQNPNDGFGYLPFPIRTAEDQARWEACRAAQAGEAGTAETTKIGSVHEHAVPKGDAPND